jgi:hypothetical protein
LPADQLAGAGEVKRLPPPDQIVPVPNGLSANNGGTEPAPLNYPSTSTP